MKHTWFEWASLVLVLSGMAISIASTLVAPWFSFRKRNKSK